MPFLSHLMCKNTRLRAGCTRNMFCWLVSWFLLLLVWKWLSSMLHSASDISCHLYSWNFLSFVWLLINGTCLKGVGLSLAFCCFERFGQLTFQTVSCAWCLMISCSSLFVRWGDPLGQSLFGYSISYYVFHSAWSLDNQHWIHHSCCHNNFPLSSSFIFWIQHLEHFYRKQKTVFFVFCSPTYRKELIQVLHEVGRDHINISLYLNTIFWQCFEIVSQCSVGFL